jgi:hypothetical protein
MELRRFVRPVSSPLHSMLRARYNPMCSVARQRQVSRRLSRERSSPAVPARELSCEWWEESEVGG